MAGLEEVRRALEGSLDREEALREAAIGSSRSLVRECRRAISSMVQSESPCDERAILGQARPILEMAAKEKGADPGLFEDALMELSEALVLSRVLDGAELPLPSEAGITERAYALGLCDAVGELRRMVLNRLLRGEREAALAMYGTMRDLFGTVEGLTYPSGMLPLKRKQDIVRGVLERTAGELAVSLAVRAPIGASREEAE